MSTVPSTVRGPAPQEREAAVILYRISDDDKQDSIPTQRSWGERVSQRDGLTVVGEFEEEGVSGASVNRPGLEDLAAFVKERFFAREPVRYLLVIDLDRFGRRDSISTGGWLDRLRMHGVRYIITTDKRFDLHSALDRTLIALSSDFTREPELRAKSNHVLNGMAAQALAGFWLGGPIPFGYRAQYPEGGSGKKKNCRLARGPEEEVEALVWIFETYASGKLTANGIARALNARGVKARWSKAGKWSRNTVLKILGNRTYLGYIVWGHQAIGRYHRLENGMVVPREDKEDREQHQLLRKLKHLPVRLLADEDCILAPGAHEALIDPKLFDACARRREQNRQEYSSPGRRAGLKGKVWPLAGQMTCGHCSQEVWTIPVTDQGGKRKGTYEGRAVVCCSSRRKDRSACPHSGATRHREVLGRVIAKLKEDFGNPRAIEEMSRKLQHQMAEEEKAGRGTRKRLTDRLGELDAKIATATRNLLQFPDDLRADAFESLRGLKADRDAAGQELRNLDAAERERQAIDPEELRATLAMVESLSPIWETEEEAAYMRAGLRDVVAEVRLYYRDRREDDPRPPRGIAPKRVLGRVEVDLTEKFVELLKNASEQPTAGSRIGLLPVTLTVDV